MDIGECQHSALMTSLHSIPERDMMNYAAEYTWTSGDATDDDGLLYAWRPHPLQPATNDMGPVHMAPLSKPKTAADDKCPLPAS